MQQQFHLPLQLQSTPPPQQLQQQDMQHGAVVRHDSRYLWVAAGGANLAASAGTGSGADACTSALLTPTSKVHHSRLGGWSTGTARSRQAQGTELCISATDPHNQGGLQQGVWTDAEPTAARLQHHAFPHGRPTPGRSDPASCLCAQSYNKFRTC